ncbi:MAG: FecR domain-containing protein [Pseudomonadota bacterium]
MQNDFHDEDERIADAARDWYLRLSEPNVTRRERQAFEAWRREDAAHAAAYAEIETAMRDLSVSFAPRRRRWPVAALVLLAVLALAFGPEAVLRLQADHVTEIGEQAQIRLPDGGIAHLNTDSALAVRYGSERRVVSLLQGEAVFDVISNPERPFIVESEGGKAVAIGTVYGVRIAEQVTVSVFNGSVAVSSAGAHRDLSAGEAADFSEDFGLGTTRTVKNAAFAWRDGFLVFDGMSLREAVAEIDRYLPGVSVPVGPAATVAVGGQIALDQLEDGLIAVASLADARVFWVTPYLRIIR